MISNLVLFGTPSKYALNAAGGAYNLFIVIAFEPVTTLTLLLPSKTETIQATW